MIKKILLGLLLLVLIGGGLIYFRMNSILHSAVVDRGPEVLGVNVELQSLNLSPFSGEAGLKGFALGQPAGWGDGNMVSVEDFQLKLVPKSVMSDHIIIETIKIDRPVIAARMKGKKNNFTSFSEQLTEKLGLDASEESNTTLTVKDFYLQGAEISVEVEGLGMADTTIKLADIHLEDLGTDEKGLTPSELARHLMAVIEPQVIKALTSAQGKKLIGTVLKKGLDTTGGAKDLLEKGIGGLLKKKKKKDNDEGN